MTKDMPKSVVRWYRRWISHFPETFHPTDLAQFYMFVSILLRNGRKERSRDWLKENLEADCPKLSADDIKEYCDIYEHIKNYHNVWRSNLAKMILKDEWDERMDALREEYKS